MVVLTRQLQFGSKPKSATQPRGASSTAGRRDGSEDTSSASASYEGSPVVQLGNYYHAPSAAAGSAQHHTLHPHDPNPYFAHGGPVFVAVGASPAESPLEASSASPNEYLYPRSHDRFPFYGSETYAPAAIRG
jgi:hypothetical protein